MKKLYTSLLCVALVCVFLPVQAKSKAKIKAKKAPVIAQAPLGPQHTITGSLLHDVMLAEIALNREQYALAAQYYQRAAEESTSPALQKRAKSIAQFVQANGLQSDVAIAESADVSIRMALLKLRQNQLSQAQPLLLKGMKQDAEQGKVLLLTLATEGSSRLWSPETKAPEKLLLVDQLAQAFPDWPEAWLARSLGSAQNNDADNAVRYAEAALERVQKGESTHMKDPLHLYLAKLYEAQRQLPKAEAAYAQVTQESLQDEALRGLLSVQLRQNDLPGGQATLQKLLAMNDKDATLWRLQGQLYKEKGEQQQALVAYDNALKLNVDDIDLRYERAMLADEAGQFALAEADLRGILQVKPNDASALNSLGYLLMIRANRLDEADVFLGKALALKPDAPEILDSVGWLRVKQNKPQEGLPYLQRAYKLAPYGEIAAHLVEALHLTGQKAQAKTFLQEAMQAHPSDKHLVDVEKRLGAQ